jgi:hypothetical protein
MLARSEIKIASKTKQTVDFIASRASSTVSSITSVKTIRSGYCEFHYKLTNK